MDSRTDGRAGRVGERAERTGRPGGWVSGRMDRAGGRRRYYMMSFWLKRIAGRGHIAIKIAEFAVWLFQVRGGGGGVKAENRLNITRSAPEQPHGLYGSSLRSVGRPIYAPSTDRPTDGAALCWRRTGFSTQADTAASNVESGNVHSPHDNTTPRSWAGLHHRRSRHSRQGILSPTW